MDFSKYGCSAFKHCASCLFDGYDVYNRIPLQCLWNTTMQLCIETPQKNGTLKTSRPSSCGPLPCGLAGISSNMYVCDGSWGGWILTLNIFLLLWCAVHIVWMWTLSQAPWNVDPRQLATALSHVFRQTHTSLPDLPMLSSSPTTEDFDFMACINCQLPRVIDAGVESTTKMLQAPVRTCVYCTIHQYARFPLVVGLSVCCCSVACLFSVSLPTTFAIVYHIYLHTISSLSILTFYLYTHSLLLRTDHGGVCDKYFTKLALVLVYKWTTLTKLLGRAAVGVHNTEETTIGELPSSAGNSVSREGSSSANAASDPAPLPVSGSYLGPLPDVFSNNFVRGPEEMIVWWEKPSPWEIAVNMRSLFQILLSTILVIVPLFEVLTTKYWVMECILGIFVGVMVIGFILILVSCDRAHILTTQRVVTLSRSILWRYVHEQSLEISTLCCAAVLKSTDLGMHFNTVSFQHPSLTPGRKLPPLSCGKFTCVRDVATFVHLFSQLAPPLDETHMAGFLQAQREEHTAYLFLCCVGLWLCPLPMYYHVVFTPGQWAWILVCFAAIIQSVLHNCVQRLTTTVVRLHSAKYWSWRKRQLNATSSTPQGVTA